DPVQDQYFNPAALNFYTYAWSAPTGLVDPDGRVPVPWHLVLGNAVHRAVGDWFMATFPGSFTEYRIQGFGLRLDMMKPGPSGVWEVYELKPAGVFGNPGKLRGAIKQVEGYMSALRASGMSAQAGGSWNPQGQIVPWNSMFNVVLTSNAAAPGVIGHSLSPTNNAISTLVNVYGVAPDIVAMVLALLLAAAAAGSQSPLFQPTGP
ncbi:MAG: hypothetical protein QME77_11010, partial [bacterium]|nr:hypothetical protein [bacterium]